MKSRDPRVLDIQKASRVKVVRGIPNRNEGQDGDLAVSEYRNEIKMYIKYKGAWHGISVGKSFDDIKDKANNAISKQDKKPLRMQLSTNKIHSDSNFDLDSSGDITLDADGGQVYIKDGGVSHFEFDCDSASLKIHDDTDATDWFRILVSTNGQATMTTYDNDGTGGVMTLKPDGDLTLDPDSQNVVINATDKLNFDSRPGDGTYIQESADDVLSIYVGGDEMLKIDESVDLGGTLTSQGSLMVKERIQASAYVAGQGQIWVKQATPNQLWFTNDADDDIQLTSGAANAATQTLHHYQMHQFYASATTDVYVPFGASTVEGSSTSTTMIDDTFWIAPFDGKLVKAYLYARTGPDETDLKLRINGTLGSSVLSGGAVDADSGSTVYSFTCDQNNTFSEGDVINLFIDITTAPFHTTMTTVWEITG